MKIKTMYTLWTIVYLMLHVVVYIYTSLLHSDYIILLWILGGLLFALIGGNQIRLKGHGARVLILIGITCLAQFMGLWVFANRTKMLEHGDYESWVFFKLILAWSLVLVTVIYVITALALYFYRKMIDRDSRCNLKLE